MVALTTVDPELRRAARLLPKGYSLHRGLRVQRALMNFAGRIGRVRGVDVASVNEDVDVRVHHACGEADPKSAEPKPAEPKPALLWIHGGGMVMGTAAQEDTFCRKLANATDVMVAAVDHRLAPEHPYPAPLEDCYAALLWLARQPSVDPRRIAIGGASAGGGLTASLAHLARDRGEIQPALQILVYPMLDDRTGTGGDRQPRIMWSARDNRLAWSWYLAGADAAVAAPARREDLSGLPPAWIGAGTLDLLHDESVAYGDRLREAGVPVHVESVQGAYHAFDLISPKAGVSQRFFASQCRSLRSALFNNLDGSP